MLVVDLAESARAIPPAPTAFCAFVEAELPQIAEALLPQIQAQVPRYFAISADPPLERVLGNLAAYAAALADPTLLITSTQQQVGPTFAHSLELREVLLLVSLFREHFTDLGLRALADGVGGAAAGMRTLMALVDLRTRLFGQLFHDLQQMFLSLVENALDTIVVADVAGTPIYRNAASRRTGEKPPIWYIDDQERMAALAAEEREQLEQEVMPKLLSDGFWQGASWCTRADGQRRRMQNSVIMLRHSNGQPLGVGAFARDVTADHEAELARAALQGQVIEAQQAALRELSTPMIPLADGIIAMPLVGMVDSTRAQQVVEELLQGVAQNRAATAIIDITGVPVVDTQVAEALVRAARAVELLGARVILTGIRPEVAQTLVGIGADLGRIVTRSTLQDGIAYALRQPR